MGRLTAALVGRFRAWETSAQVALVLALGALLAALLWLMTAPPAWRIVAFGAFLGALAAFQVIFMWANRGMVTPYTHAQRQYLAGDYAAAQQTLEAALNAGQTDVRTRTLLGNVYRQLGDLPASDETLRLACEDAPNDHYARYGFGRTLLMLGLYAEAAAAFEQALADGAPLLVRFDQGEALYYLGQAEAAREALLQAQQTEQEAGRALLNASYLYHLGVGAIPDAALVAAGWDECQAQAARFGHTPFGVALAAELQRLASAIREG